MTTDGGYAERAPAAALAPWIECYWTRGPLPPGSGGKAHRVLPDGCVDLVLARPAGDAPRGGDALDGWLDGAYVVGAMTRPLLVDGRDALAFVGVRVRPGMAALLLPAAAGAVTDLRVPLADVWGARGLDRARHAGAGAPSLLAALDAVLLRRLADASVPADVVAATGLIRRTRGATTVADISRALGVTRQHLARRFDRYVGVTPKTLSRIVRLQGVLAAARAHPRRDWGRLAAEHGYADQPHLAADFRRLTGLTPGGWRAEWASRAVPILQDTGAAAT